MSSIDDKPCDDDIHLKDKLQKKAEASHIVE